MFLKILFWEGVQGLATLPRNLSSQKWSSKGEEYVSPHFSLLPLGTGWEWGQGRVASQSLCQVFCAVGWDLRHYRGWSSLMRGGCLWGGESEDEEWPRHMATWNPTIAPNLRNICHAHKWVMWMILRRQSRVTRVSPTPGSAGAGNSCGRWPVSGLGSSRLQRLRARSDRDNISSWEF